MAREMVAFAILCAALHACGASDAPSQPGRPSAMTAADTMVSTEGEYSIEVGPDVFGTTTAVIGRMSYHARADAAGTATGRFRFSESADGITTHYTGVVTCIGVYDFDGRTQNRAKIGARIENSDDLAAPEGTFIWWQAIDDGQGRGEDKSTFTGFGDEAANIAFCQSANPPRFGPFPVRGEINVDTLDHE